MGAPQKGQPFLEGHEEFSIGDMNAGVGTVAWDGVTINVGAADVAPPIVIALHDTPTFTLTTWLRLAATHADFHFVDPVIMAHSRVEHHIQSLDPTAPTLLQAGGTVVAAPAGEPAGASAAFPGANLKWYKATSDPISLVEGTYTILSHVHGEHGFESALAAFHDHTYLMVVP